ncbi:PREDICTED: alpha-ketoglutarate-dependent dioxygenase alkB homolog 6 [Ceratosolen solmsi marchali]|uniref:Alpha-ketoglutarate-dependent dioxygenase alkB homolog 6 n=1 Tax=Ceratosolen solmsi marchali TaxID=326594 RepID=A0AAJ6YRV0_9HYME|nr:PREDICTED: alpha-ketoglutarate-dependent dioxygenase alkB homolog 6 [Ceratosolen solmsi marchali]
MELINYQNLLAESIVKEVPSLINYIPNFITEEEEKNLIQEIYNAPLPKWTQLSHRRLQNYGGIPHVKGMIAEEIPKWLEAQIDKITLLNMFHKEKRPNHVLINEYLSGQGIMAHSDGPLFHPIVTTISCGSHTLLEFHKAIDTDNIESRKHEFSLLLEPRSLLILQDDLYHNYLHSIEERITDTITQARIKNLHMCSQIYKESQILKRSTRLSLTIRHVPKTSKFKLKFGK